VKTGVVVHDRKFDSHTNTFGTTQMYRYTTDQIKKSLIKGVWCGIIHPERNITVPCPFNWRFSNHLQLGECNVTFEWHCMNGQYQAFAVMIKEICNCLFKHSGEP